jgi:hypothetical protein
VLREVWKQDQEMNKSKDIQSNYFEAQSLQRRLTSCLDERAIVINIQVASSMHNSSNAPSTEKDGIMPARPQCSPKPLTLVASERQNNSRGFF